MNVRTQRDQRNSLIFTVLGGLVVFVLSVTVLAPLANRVLNPPPVAPTATPMPATATPQPSPVGCSLNDYGLQMGLAHNQTWTLKVANSTELTVQCINGIISPVQAQQIQPSPRDCVVAGGFVILHTQPWTQHGQPVVCDNGRLVAQGTAPATPTATVAPIVIPTPTPLTTCGAGSYLPNSTARVAPGVEVIVGNQVYTCNPAIADPADDGWIITGVTFDPAALSYCPINGIGPNGDSLWFRPGSKVVHNGAQITCVGGRWDP